MSASSVVQPFQMDPAPGTTIRKGLGEQVQVGAHPCRWRNTEHPPKRPSVGMTNLTVRRLQRTYESVGRQAPVTTVEPARHLEPQTVRKMAEMAGFDHPIQRAETGLIV